MSDFGITFPHPVDGDELYEVFESMAEEGTDGPFGVRITDREIFDLDQLLKKFEDPAEYAELKHRQRQDERNLNRSENSFFHVPGPTRGAEWFLSATKPGLEVEVYTKRMNSVKDFFFPLSTRFEVDPDEEYINLGEKTSRRYNEEHIEAFEPFAEELYEELGYNPDQYEELVTDDIPLSGESDYHMKGMRMGGNPRGRRFLF